jgi:2'-5' RNA ligase
VSRLFAALTLPADARAALHAWAAAVVAADPALRAIPEASLHVTLVFLGEQEEGRVPALSRIVGEAAPGADELLEVSGAAFLPVRRPGVLVADVAASASLVALRAGLARALMEFRALETRPWRPHVTVARVRRGVRPGAPPAAPPALRFAPAGVVLYRSNPGSRYEAL